MAKDKSAPQAGDVVPYGPLGWAARRLPGGEALSGVMDAGEGITKGVGNLGKGIKAGAGASGKMIDKIGAIGEQNGDSMADEADEERDAPPADDAGTETGNEAGSEAGVGEGTDDPGEQSPPENQDAQPAVDEEEDMPPEGHEQWLQHYEYASQRHPVLYNMHCQYADAQQAALAAKDQSETDDGQDNEGDEAGLRPAEDTSAGLPGAERGAADEGADEAATTTGEPGRPEMPRPGEEPPPMPMQESTMPVAYQQVIQQMNQRLGALEAREKSKDKQIAALQGKLAYEEARGLVSQLISAGKLPLYDADPEKAAAKCEEMTQRLAKMKPDHRIAYFQECMEYWAEDKSLAYAAHGAPVATDFVGVFQEKQRKPNGQPEFGEAELEKAQAYMQAHPGCDWEKAYEYAMGGSSKNGQVVTS